MDKLSLSHTSGIEPIIMEWMMDHLLLNRSNKGGCYE